MTAPVPAGPTDAQAQLREACCPGCGLAEGRERLRRAQRRAQEG